MIRGIALIVGLLVIAPRFAPGDETREKDKATKQERKLLEGVWEKTGRVTDGREVPVLPDDGKLRLTLKDGKFTFEFKDGKVVDDGTFTIDPTVTPKQMDLSGRGKNEMPVIYELRKNELKICSAPRGEKRPTKIESKEGSGCTIDIWKRVK